MFEFLKPKATTEGATSKEEKSLSKEGSPRFVLKSGMALVMALMMHGHDAKAADLSMDLASASKRMSVGTVDGKASGVQVDTATLTPGPIGEKIAGAKIEPVKKIEFKTPGTKVEGVNSVFPPK